MEKNFKSKLVSTLAATLIASSIFSTNVHALELSQIEDVSVAIEIASLSENIQINSEVIGNTLLTEKNEDVLSLVLPETGEELIVGTAYTITKTEYNELCKIIQAEAGNQDMEGKILVGNVILNRVANAKFPNTIHEVIFQKSQFSPVSNGSYKKAVPSDEVYEAVNRLLNGEDYSLGALYFRATSSNSNWGKLKLILSHGGHKFYI